MDSPGRFVARERYVVTSGRQKRWAAASGFAWNCGRNRKVDEEFTG
jgi:hypothetical protein